MKKKLSVSFEFTKDQNVVIDINCWLYRSCSKQSNTSLQT